MLKGGTDPQHRQARQTGPVGERAAVGVVDNRDDAVRLGPDLGAHERADGLVGVGEGDRALGTAALTPNIVVTRPRVVEALAHEAGFESTAEC